MKLSKVLMIIKNHFKKEKEDFFSKLKDVCPIDEQKERKKQFLKKFNITMEKNALNFTLGMMLFFSCFLIELKSNYWGIWFQSSFLFESTWLNLAVWLEKYCYFLKTLQGKQLCLPLENIIRGGRSSGMGNRYEKRMKLKKYCVLMQRTYSVGLWVILYFFLNLKLREILMDETTYLGFSVLELSKLHICIHLITMKHYD